MVRNMIIISSREFREKQKLYFDKVDDGQQIVIQRGHNKSYRLVPVEESDICLNEDDFYTMIESSVKQAKEGKITRIDDFNEFKKLLGL